MQVFDFAASHCQRSCQYLCRGRKTEGHRTSIRREHGLPSFVIGDQRLVKQAISNVIANAVQNTSVGAVTLEVNYAEHADDHVCFEIVIQDSGVGMSAIMVNYLLLDLEGVSFEDYEIFMDENEPAHDGKPENSKRLGLGLAQVGRFARIVGGQLRINLEEGKGSRFVIRLGFGLPDINKQKPFNRGSFVEK